MLLIRFSVIFDFFVDVSPQIWMNCLAFWKSLQEYNAYFFADSLNPSLLSRKARVRIK